MIFCLKFKHFHPMKLTCIYKISKISASFFFRAMSETVDMTLCTVYLMDIALQVFALHLGRPPFDGRTRNSEVTTVKLICPTITIQRKSPLIIILVFCTEHGSHTARLCAKYQNDYQWWDPSPLCKIVEWILTCKICFMQLSFCEIWFDDVHTEFFCHCRPNS